MFNGRSVVMVLSGNYRYRVWIFEPDVHVVERRREEEILILNELQVPPLESGGRRRDEDEKVHPAALLDDLMSVRFCISCRLDFVSHVG